MCLSIICNMHACDIFQEPFDRTNSEISKFTYYSIVWCMFYDRRRKAYRSPQMIKRSFQHKLTAFFCGRSIRCRPRMFIALAAPKPKPPSNYNFVSKSLERPHSSS